ncbi:MAG: DUF5916 domain-containing protein [Gemmatimonadota bacterium]
MRSLPLPLSLLLVAVPVAAQTGSPGTPTYPVDPTAIPRPALAVRRAADVIRIDGRLDEADWAQADSTSTDFIQVQPSPGYPASEPTVIRILYDDQNLYIGATLYEAEPDKLIVPGLEQDYSTRDSDILGIALDTYRDRQNGFLWAINPAGAVWDAQAFDDSRNINMAWEGIVDVRTTVGEDRWTVEMAIPFTTLRYTPGEGAQTWGLAFSRRIRHLNEESNWSPTERQYKLYKFSLAGSLEGLKDLRKNRNISIKPYVLANRLSAGMDGASSSSGDVGFDVKWGLTPRLTLDVTANTDFSQVEVDQEQVNLTRFSLFFPEKRDFFLENEGTFGFQDVTIRNYRTGSSARSFKLFHSRRIGLSPDRTPLAIVAGGRVTGKVGGNLEVGFLDMQTRSTGSLSDQDFLPGENFGVARVKALVGARASVGAMFVNRQETAPATRGYNRSFGVDGHVTLFDNLVVSAYAARTEEDEPTGDSRDALMMQAAWRDPLWDVSILAKHVGRDFNPGVGFVDRTGVRRFFTTVGAHPRVDSRYVIELNPFVDVDVYTGLGGALESRAVTPTLSVLFRDGGIFQVEASDRYERLLTPTSIAGGLVDAGIYEWREARASYTVSGSHVLSGRLSLSGGDFYDGTRFSIGATTRFRPNPHFSMDVGIQRNDLRLAGRDFTADVYSARFRWARDVRTFLLGFVQYNGATDEVVSNVRFNLIHAPLSDLFLVYTERRSLADSVPEAVPERGFTLKVTKLLAF